MKLTEENFRMLKATRFLASLKEEDAQLIAAEASLCRFDAGQVLFSEGTPATAFYVVLDGWVTLCRDNINGERTVIHLLGPGETFAEALILPGAHYPVTAEAASQLHVAKLETGRFRSLISSNPELALSIISGTFMQLKSLVDRIERDNGWSAQRRVASFLVSLCGNASAECSFTLPVEQQLIAARLSMSPATLSRTLNTLTPAGVFARRGCIVISDVARLRQLAEKD
jgi:CRP/FNR family transcriptional regulator, dissimilatory nitrate respiration regulator